MKMYGRKSVPKRRIRDGQKYQDGVEEKLLFGMELFDAALWATLARGLRAIARLGSCNQLTIVSQRRHTQRWVRGGIEFRCWQISFFVAKNNTV